MLFLREFNFYFLYSDSKTEFLNTNFLVLENLTRTFDKNLVYIRKLVLM